MYSVKIQLTSGGHYGKAFINMRRPKIEDLLDYFQAGDNSILAKNQLVSTLCDTDISKYPIGDREFIFANIRSMVNSNVITGMFPCTRGGCEDKVAYALDLSKCKVHQLPPDFEANYTYTFPVSKKEKVLNLLTVEREELLEDYLKLYEASDIPLSNTDLGENLGEFARYACMLGDSESIVKIDENITFLRDLPWDDFEKLILYDISFSCGPDISTEAVCDKCKQKYRVNVKTDSTFFGLSLEGMINRHRFLAKATNIGFSDFLKYTVPIMHTVTEAEVQRQKDHNAKVKAGRGRKK